MERGDFILLPNDSHGKIRYKIETLEYNKTKNQWFATASYSPKKAGAL